MEIRFVRPEEEAALAKNIVTGFPSKTPPELLARLGKELREPEEGLFLGCFLDDGSLAGSILMMDFQLNGRDCLCFHFHNPQKGACGQKSDPCCLRDLCGHRDTGRGASSV